jgi:hypothetical protein
MVAADDHGSMGATALDQPVVVRQERRVDVRRRDADVLTVRALQHGLAPRAPTPQVVRELADRVHGDRRPLERARQRIERGLEHRPTPVGERARAILEAALDLVASEAELPLEPRPPREDVAPASDERCSSGLIGGP